MLGRLLSGAVKRPLPEAAPAQPEPQPSAGPPTPDVDPLAQPPATLRQAEDAVLADEVYFRRRQLELASLQAQFAGMQLHETLLAHPSLADPKRLERWGGKTFSQSDEDGIIAEIFSRIGAPHRTFVEFGCGDGMENNTLCLLSQGWRGFWMDGGDANAQRIHSAYQPLIDAGLLQFRQQFIDRENIDGLVAQAGLGAEIDLLSIDLDGNDYYVWDAIVSVSARVVVIEYNAKFLPRHDWSMAYDAQYSWQGGDLHGASLAALARLGAAKGYQLVGCNLTGANAFFVRADLAGDKFATPATPLHLFQPSRYSLVSCFIAGHPVDTATVVQGAFAAAGLPWPPEQEVASLIGFRLP